MDVVDMNKIPGPGKFEGNEDRQVAEDLFSLTIGGWYNEQFGNIDEDGMWEALLTNVTVKSGKASNYIVTEDNQGFFTYKEYPIEKEAWTRYFADLAAYDSYHANGENL